MSSFSSLALHLLKLIVLVFLDGTLPSAMGLLKKLSKHLPFNSSYLVVLHLLKLDSVFLEFAYLNDNIWIGSIPSELGNLEELSKLPTDTACKRHAF